MFNIFTISRMALEAFKQAKKVDDINAVPLEIAILATFGQIQSNDNDYVDTLFFGTLSKMARETTDEALLAQFFMLGMGF